MTKTTIYLLIAAFVAGGVLGGFVLDAFTKPCPEVKIDHTLQAKFDSVTTANTALLQQIDALSNMPPIIQRVREQLRTSSSLGLDSLGAVLLADPD